MRTHSLIQSFLSITLACSPALSAGCGEQSFVQGGAVLAQQSSALSTGVPHALVGTYTGCSLHTDGEAWTSYFGPSSGSSLKVLQGDTGCQLAIVRVLMQGGQSYEAEAPLALSGSASAPVAFAVQGGQPNFYASAWMSQPTFASDFSITLWHSEDPSVKMDSKMATLVVTGTVTSSSVAAPTYDLVLGGLTVYKELATSKVYLTTGNAVLAPNGGGVSAQEYFLQPGACSTAPAALNGAWMAASRLPLSAPLSGASFGLVPQTTVLPVTSCLVLSNCLGSICSYETFSVTFQ